MRSTRSATASTSMTSSSRLGLVPIGTKYGRCFGAWGRPSTRLVGEDSGLEGEPIRLSGGQMRIKTSLVVLSDSLDAPTITRRIGTFPDESWQIGDRAPGGASQRHNGWSVAVSSETGALSECLDELLERLRPHGRHIAALVRDGVAHARVWLY